MRENDDRDRLARALIVAHLCLFAPFAWLVATDDPWDPYRWTWVRLWPILPGFIPGAYLRGLIGLDDPGMFLVMALTTTAEIVLFTLIGRRGTAEMIGAGGIALAVSGFSSWVAHAAFLA